MMQSVGLNSDCCFSSSGVRNLESRRMIHSWVRNFSSIKNINPCWTEIPCAVKKYLQQNQKKNRFSKQSMEFTGKTFIH